MRFIQIPEQPGLARTRAGTPQGSMNAAGAPWQAVARVGEAVAGTGQYFAQLSERVQRSNDEDYLTRYNTEALKAQRRISEKIAAEPDESKWEGIADREMRGIKVDPKGASGRARERGQQFVSDFRQREITRVHGQALKQDAQRKARNKENEIEELVREGDLDAVEQTLSGAVEAGVFTREVADSKLLAARERVTYYEVTSMIEDDPEAAAEALTEKTEGGNFRNFKDLRPDSRRTLTGMARQRGDDEKREVLTQLVLEAERGEPRGHEEIVTLMEDGKISPWHAAQYRQSYLGDKGAQFDVERYASTMRQIDDYDPHEDTNRTRFSELMGSLIGMPSQEVSILRRRLEDKLDPDSNRNSFSTEEAWDRINGLYESGAFGEVGTDIDGKPMDPEASRQASQQWLRMKDEFDRFLDRNESPSRLEQNEFLDGLLRESEDIRNLRALEQEKEKPPEESGDFFRKVLRGSTFLSPVVFAHRVLTGPDSEGETLPEYLQDIEASTIREAERKAIAKKGDLLTDAEADLLERRFKRRNQ